MAPVREIGSAGEVEVAASTTETGTSRTHSRSAIRLSPLSVERGGVTGEETSRHPVRLLGINCRVNKIPRMLDFARY